MKESTAVENLHRAVVASKLQLLFFLSIGGKGHPVEAAHSARDVHRWQQCCTTTLGAVWDGRFRSEKQRICLKYKDYTSIKD